MTKYHRYKVSGTVKFSVDDVIADSPEDAKEFIKDDPGGNAEWAHEHGTCEVLEVAVEQLRPATKEEVVKAVGEQEWED